MKNMRILLRACVVAGIILAGVALAACASAGAGTGVPVRYEDPAPAVGGFLGATLHLSGSMWAMSIDQESEMPVLERLNEDKAVYSDFGVSGTFANGQLAFSMGSPAPSFLEPIVYMFLYQEDAVFSRVFYRDLSINAPETMFAILAVLDASNKGFSRQYFSDTEQNIVAYVYVDRDVTITAAGTTLSKWDRTVITDDLDITLRAGWNALHSRMTWYDEIVRSITLGDPPHLRWVGIALQ